MKKTKHEYGFDLSKFDVRKSIMLIKPEMAQKIMAKAAPNRRIRMKHVNSFAEAMKNGRWEMCGDALSFNTKGQLVDGNHRCLASIKANAPFFATILSNVPDRAILAKDTGTGRTGPDNLFVAGFKYGTALVGAMRFIKTYANESSSTLFLSNFEVNDFIKKWPELETYAAQTHSISYIIPHSMMTAWCFIANIDPKKRKKFEEALAVLTTGIPAYPGDPLYMFREKVIRTKHQLRLNETGRLEMFYTLIDCWNKFAQGKTVTRVKLTAAIPKPMTEIDKTIFE